MLVQELLEKMNTQRIIIDIYKFDDECNCIDLFKVKTKGRVSKINIPNNVLNMTVDYYSISPKICDFEKTDNGYESLSYFELEIVFNIKVCGC